MKTAARRKLAPQDHRALILWAAATAARVLRHFERERPGDPRPRRAIKCARAWARGKVRFPEVRVAALAAHAAARAAKHPAAVAAARAAGQAVATAHVPTHALGAGAYARRARAAARLAGKRGQPAPREKLLPAIWETLRVLPTLRLRNALRRRLKASVVRRKPGRKRQLRPRCAGP